MDRVRDLHLLAGAVCLSALGDFLALITLALLVHDLTSSSWAVAALFATTMVPVVALAPLAGAMADRVESVRVLAVTSLLQCAAAAALAFTGDLTLLLVLASLLAAGNAFSQPAEFALVPAIAGRDRLAHANGVMETARYVGFTAGPLLAAVLAANGGARLALLVNAASFLAIAVAAGALRARRKPAAVQVRKGSEESWRAGAAFLWRDGVLRTLVLAATGALILISASLTAEVFYVKDVLHAGDSGYALVTAAWMGGMVLGATVVAGRVPAVAMASIALLALALQGAGMAAQTAWTILPAALAGYAIGGVGHGLKNTLLRTVIQLRVPDAAHGRAFAAYNALRNTAELGALALGGVLVAALGARSALLVAGTGPVLAGLAGLVALQLCGARRTEADVTAAV